MNSSSKLLLSLLFPITLIPFPVFADSVQLIQVSRLDGIKENTDGTRRGKYLFAEGEGEGDYIRYKSRLSLYTDRSTVRPSFLVSLNSKLETNWSAEINPYYTVNNVRRTRDGGYLVVNTMYKNKEDFSFRLVKIAKDSRSEYDKDIGRQTNLGIRSIDDGVDLDDGFLVAGYASAITESGKKYSPPWVAKLDNEAQIVWQRTFAENDDSNLSLHATEQTQIIPLLGGGYVVKFVPIFGLTDKAKAQGRTEDSVYKENNQCIFLVRIGPDGEELSRYRGSGIVEGSQAFRLEKGFALIEAYFLPIKGNSPTTFELMTARRGIRYTELDDDLRTVSSSQFSGTGLEQRLMAVEGPKGGFFLAGREVSKYSDCGSVGYLSNGGKSLTAKVVADSSRSLNCRIEGLVASVNKDQALLFVEPLQGRSLEIYRLKFEFQANR